MFADKFDSESTASSKVAEILFGLGNEPNVYIVQNLFARSDQPNSSFLPNINNFSLSTDHSSKSNKKSNVCSIHTTIHCFTELPTHFTFYNSSF